jgi:hypothetical protein
MPPLSLGTRKTRRGDAGTMPRMCDALPVLGIFHIRYPVLTRLDLRVARLRRLGSDTAWPALFAVVFWEGCDNPDTRGEGRPWPQSLKAWSASIRISPGESGSSAGRVFLSRCPGHGGYKPAIRAKLDLSKNRYCGSAVLLQSPGTSASTLPALVVAIEKSGPGQLFWLAVGARNNERETAA